jgi:hypothetical protein
MLVKIRAITRIRFLIKKINRTELKITKIIAKSYIK